MSDLTTSAARLRDATARLRFPGAAFVYHPLQYAWEPHARYLRRYGRATGRALFVGMNPGPWGMAQTGVPFADPATARGWMGIEGRVISPTGRTHPKRPVLGFASSRADPSGRRFYGWARERCGTAAGFFDEFFVGNYCPLLFLDEAGRNVPASAIRHETLRAACDEHAAAMLRALRPRLVLAMGAYVERQLARVIEAERSGVPLVRVLHPSPANPANNAGWTPAI